MEQKDEEKNIPSTAAKAINLSSNERSEFIHLIAQFAFFCIIGIVDMALNK